MKHDTHQMLDARLRGLDPLDDDTMGAADIKAQALMRAIMAGELSLAESDVRGAERDRAGLGLGRLAGPTRSAAPPRALGLGKPAARHRALGRFAALATALAVAIAVGGIVTTPGKAVTSWIGEQIGVTNGSSSSAGEPGGLPSMQKLREFAHQGASPAGGQPAVVIARGSLPYSRHYEIVAYRPKPVSRSVAPDPVCFELDFPEVSSIGGIGCDVPASSTSLVLADTGENASATQAFSYATGLVGDDVARVDVAVHGHPADVQLVPIRARLLKQFGVDRPVKLFMATFDSGATGRLTATARNAVGASVDEHAAELGRSSGG